MFRGGRSEYRDKLFFEELPNDALRQPRCRHPLGCACPGCCFDEGDVFFWPVATIRSDTLNGRYRRQSAATPA